MEPYPNCSTLNACTISERTKHFKQTVLEYLQRTGGGADLAPTIDSALSQEQYEMVAGISLACEQFKQNPQLALF